jgi:small subunit ribosomal protein S16
MVVRLRLQRFGRTHAPFYRMVAAHDKSPRDGRYLEVVGTYNPIVNRDGAKEIRLKTDRIKYWISVGAQLSDRVAWVLGKFGILPPTPRKFNPTQMIPRKQRKEEAKKASATAKK